LEHVLVQVDIEIRMYTSIHTSLLAMEDVISGVFF